MYVYIRYLRILCVFMCARRVLSMIYRSYYVFISVVAAKIEIFKLSYMSLSRDNHVLYDF
jgi:hypothetical protein